MSRPMQYPKHYPSHPATNTRRAAWDFLLLNQGTAAEACVLWFSNELERVVTIRMARAAAKKDQVKSLERADWTGYANIDLSAEDKQAIKGGVLDGESVLDIVGDMLGTGHKVALTYDREKDTVSAAATGVYTYCENAGLTLTCFARNITDVLTVLAYKHEVIAKGKWGAFARAKRDVDDLG